MATFPARLLRDMLLWPAAGIVLRRHLKAVLSMTCEQRIITDTPGKKLCATRAGVGKFSPTCSPTCFPNLQLSTKSRNC